MADNTGCLRCGKRTGKAEHAWCSQRCRGLFGAWKTWQATTVDGKNERALTLRRCADLDNDRADALEGLEGLDATSPEARRLRNRVARTHERADSPERYARSLRALVRPRLPVGEMAA